MVGGARRQGIQFCGCRCTCPLKDPAVIRRGSPLILRASSVSPRDAHQLLHERLHDAVWKMLYDLVADNQIEGRSPLQLQVANDEGDAA